MNKIDEIIKELRKRENKAAGNTSQWYRGKFQAYSEAIEIIECAIIEMDVINKKVIVKNMCLN